MEIGSYRTIRLLGKGGMSEVYEVENLKLGSRHALKLFTYEKDDPEIRERFQVEGKLLARLNHPRIVKVTDLGLDESSGRPYFVMDLIQDSRGEMKLLSDIEPGTADEETIGRWYDDLRDGLDYIHANGVVHRDLKLQNVLIGPDGHAVLADFGISKIFDAKGDGVQVVDTVRTLVKVKEGRSLVMGSLGYMAPELEMGVAASPQSDWYALGVIVYRLLTGTWCDSRTDVVGTLETYDPVWNRIIPKLLHANPNGRECLSYEEETRKDREKFAFESENRWLREKRRGHWARHIARLLGVVTVGLCVALAFAWNRHREDRKVWAAKLVAGGNVVSVLEFDELFRIPPEAKSTEVQDSDGRTLMSSRSQFEATRVDALVLAYGILDQLRAGRITLDSAILRLEDIRGNLGEGKDVSPFDQMIIGDGRYVPIGDDDALSILFEKAIEKLKTLEE